MTEAGDTYARELLTEAEALTENEAARRYIQKALHTLHHQQPSTTDEGEQDNHSE